MECCQLVGDAVQTGFEMTHGMQRPVVMLSGVSISTVACAAEPSHATHVRAERGSVGGAVKERDIAQTRVSVL